MSKKIVLACLFVFFFLSGIAWWLVGDKKPNAPSKTPQKNQSAQKVQEATTFDKKRYSLEDPNSIWVVVNKQRPLSPLSYAPADLINIGNGQTMRAEAATAFMKLLSDAKSAGYTLVAESGYRSYQTQVSVYNHEVQVFGQAKADSESAKPGYSEHQTGWAVDIGSPGCYEDCFGTTKAAPWLKDHAYQYGFVLRYPADKTDITGYRNEPWHFRYVGTDLSQEMHNQNVTTLEEFFNL